MTPARCSFYEICLQLGLRQSEAFGLRSSDVDLTAASLSIRQSLAPIRAVDREKGIASGQLRLGLGAYPENLGRLIPLEGASSSSSTTSARSTRAPLTRAIAGALFVALGVGFVVFRGSSALSSLYADLLQRLESALR